MLAGIFAFKMSKDEQYKYKSIPQKLQEEIDDFRTGQLLLAKGDDDIEGSGYYYNQASTINAVLLAYDGKFKHGKTDSQGRRKYYLNECKFRADVSKKQTDLDVKNFLFKPTSYGSIYTSQLFGEDFRYYTREQGYGQAMNVTNEDFSKIGSALSKRVGKKIEPVSVTKIMNTPDAESLKQAAESGGYVIETHKLTYIDLQRFPKWKTDDIARYDGKKDIYERYSMVTEAEYKMWNDETPTEDDFDDYHLCMAIVCLDTGVKTETSKTSSSVLFLEKITDFPYEEVHWSRRVGRWLGVGVVEELLENQLIKNKVLNTRLNALEWYAKKIFQSTDPSVAKNLSIAVEDGQVLEVMPGGQIQEVVINSRGLGDFQSMDNLVDGNSDKKAFTYEVITGEGSPSGTPFRLAVYTGNEANKYFLLQRETLGLFFKRAYFNQLVPIFKNQTKEHTLTLAWNTGGLELLKNAYIEMRKNDIVRDSFLVDRKPITEDEARFKVVEQLEKEPFMFWNIRKEAYENIFYTLELDLTGESSETQKEVESLTNLYSAMVQAQDPRSERVLDFILANTGINYNSVAGLKPQAPTQQQGGMPNPNLISMSQQPNEPVIA